MQIIMPNSIICLILANVTRMAEIGPFVVLNRLKVMSTLGYPLGKPKLRSHDLA